MIHYKLTLNLIDCYISEQWTVDFGAGPIWEEERINFCLTPMSAEELSSRHACIDSFRAMKANCIDSRNEYTVIK